ncbi:MAG: cobalamin-dependent protein [Pseudomonadota bacterium]
MRDVWFFSDLEDMVSDEECLQETIQVDVIPRLLAASRAIETEPVDARAEPDDLDAFCQVLLSDSLEDVFLYLDEMIQSGTTLDTVYLGHLAGTARRLGVLWEEDAISLGEVSMGLMRMHQILRRLSPSFVSDAPIANPMGTALFAVAPGETHALGVVIMAEFFTRGGWHTHVDLNPEEDELSQAVLRSGASVVGISASATRFLPQVKNSIDLIRRNVNGRGVYIMVGGNAFIEDQSAVAYVGADGFAHDAIEALALAKSATRNFGTRLSS